MFAAATVMALIGALVSLTRGRQFYYDSPDAAADQVRALEVTSGTLAESPESGGR